jgi:uncharacterized membrane protein SpoIIM required for sporulation
VIEKQQQFERLHAVRWRDFDALLGALETARRGSPAPADAARLPAWYRELCGHYAVARDRGYSARLTAELHALALRAHRQLYRRDPAFGWRLLAFVTTDFPRMTRRHARAMLVALALFVLPGAFAGVGCYVDSELVYSVMEANQVAEMEYMYEPGGKRLGREAGREASSDIAMFGYYISNNIGIGFRTFAAGVLAGIGTVLTLVYNGLTIGAVAGHLTRIGYGSTFWPFVCGHSAFELTAIVICGAAGLVVAAAVLFPGNLARKVAMKRAGRDAAVLVGGAAAMLLLAAFLEAFWSSSALLPAAVKFFAAAAFWTLVVLYFARAGAIRHAPR